jgi:ATP phosphoribosyltransferase
LTLGKQKRQLRFAVPKGSLQKATSELFTQAGINLKDYGAGTRSYRPEIDIPDVLVKVLRPQEIPMMVANGYYDLGISGLDWIMEQRVGADIEVLSDLKYGRVNIVLAVPEIWNNINSFEDMHENFREVRLWTEYLNIASDMVLQKTGVEPSIVAPWRNQRRRGFSKVSLLLSFGATEAKPPEDGEGVIDNTQTGSTLRDNGLKIIDYVLRNSTARLLASNSALGNPELAEKIDLINSKLKKAVAGVNNLPKKDFPAHF